jgi:hypothetical protein
MTPIEHFTINGWYRLFVIRYSNEKIGHLVLKLKKPIKINGSIP